MLQLPIYDKSGKNTGTLPVVENIFGVKMNQHVLHSVVTWYLASQRRGTHSTLTRAEVSGGGKKPWRQKGTGRARAGSNRSPLWRKGGVVFGPKPRDYSYTLPKKVRKLALRIALSEFLREGKVLAVDDLNLEGAKTKFAAKFIEGLKLKGKILMLVDGRNERFIRAARNLKGVRILSIPEINIHDLLNTNNVVIEKGTYGMLEEALR